MIKVYLASRYSKYKSMQVVRNFLESEGFLVTSRWINGDHQIDDEGLSSEAKEEERVRFAVEDIEDLKESDIVVCYTEKPRTTKSRGGRHVEMGMAIAWEKLVFVVGHRENVFCCLNSVIFCKDEKEMASKLMSIRDKKEKK